MKVPKNLYYLVFLLFCNEIIAEIGFQKTEVNEILHDFPTHKDLNGYLVSLKRIIDFSYDRRKDLDLSYSFGLFLVNVNLKKFIRDVLLPEQLRNHLKSILAKNDITIRYFIDEISDQQNKADLIKISKCIKNDNTWSKRLKKMKLLKGFRSSQNNVYPDWKTYVKFVDDIDRWKPSPEQSDFCMASLAENKENKSKRPQYCVVPNDCYKMLLAGTNFGYGLTHRLLFLLFGLYSRGCTMFSIEDDSKLRDEFCNTIYDEAKYLSYNGFKHVDLMLEQIALCALDGHAEFIRQSWLSNLLQYQTPHGCFSQRLPDQTTQDKDNEVNWKHDLMDGACNAHVTATAAASIAAAIRFIIENTSY